MFEKKETTYGQNEEYNFDINALKQTLDGSIAAMRVLDKNFNIIYQNKKMSEMTGIGQDNSS